METKTCVITFGRFNPPTKGHGLLFDTMAKQAKFHKADYMIFASHTQDPSRNPLSYSQKIKYLRNLFPEHKHAFIEANARTIIEVLKIQEQRYNYDHIIIVVGQDRVTEFRTLVNKYNGKDYSFNVITVVSAGVRDPDSDDVSGMSASKMRAAVRIDDRQSFNKGMPSRAPRQVIDNLFTDIKKQLTVSEVRCLSFKQFVEAINVDVDLRQKYLNPID